ncbi:glycosyltransferase [Solihabitans fulvus]|uniref:Glycosyltransferase n=1 Tax=Solihabitans fulvus TaxID=1892852 RepID=A0A5B2XSA6_9PSEU|nr:glycosyltransferase family 2 protein [Solihabitans fulvus]KAA2265774.1 glycosyltransferase [Solihabitans fulvus]
MPPDVTVVVPVYDAMPYLVTCLSSVFEQSIGRDRLEVIAVDDGSTDGSGTQLDLLDTCWPNLHVTHQPASGGPSHPRNVALDQARGRYVFFLDADDYLGPEALERMVALADQRDADVVACHRRSVGGPKGIASPADHVPLAGRLRHPGIDAHDYMAALGRSAAAAEQTALLVALGDCKQLFRRDLITRFGMRFDEEMIFGEDTLFSATYVDRAATVSMVSDYDCYFERVRDDGNNLTSRLIGTLSHVESLELGLRLDDRPELRWRRDFTVRDAVLDLTQQVFGGRFLRHGPDARRVLVDRSRGLLATWLTPRVTARLPALDRVKAELIARGLEAELSELVRVVAAGERGPDTIRAGRVYAGYPYLDDPTVGVPASCYDITGELEVRHRLDTLRWDGPRLRLAGHAFLERVDTVEVSTELVLRDRLGRQEHRWPVSPVPTPELAQEHGRGRFAFAGFEATVDCTDVGDGRPLAPGRWNAFLVVGAQGVRREIPLGGSRSEAVDAAAGSGSAGISVCFGRLGTLTLDVGELT